MKKVTIIVILFIGVFASSIIGTKLINQNNQEVEPQIVFIETKGYINIDLTGHGSIQLFYYNINNYDESTLSNTLTLISDQEEEIYDLNYTIQTNDTYEFYTKKMIVIQVDLTMYESFNVTKIKFRESLNQVYEIGLLTLQKNNRESEHTIQGYQVTISSFSDIPTSINYQKYVIEILNDSNHAIYLQEIKVGQTVEINQTLDIQQSINIEVDCSSFFDVDYVLVNGYINYISEQNEYTLYLDQMNYLVGLTELEVMSLINE